MRAPVHVTVWGGGRRRPARAVLVHGTLTWDTDEYGFAAQRPLADVAELVGLGAHVVGHSYGAVVAMLTAAMRP